MAREQLAPGISITTQIAPDEIAAIKAAGFRTIINNRPDQEESGQPSSADLETKAKAAGIDYRHIPVTPGRFGDDQIDAFSAAVNGCDKPVLAFCKSGMRATSLWALSQVGVLTTAEILRQAAACGYDLSPLIPHIEARAKALRH
jgi:sulfide:quinone oxidoreductase